MTNYVIRCENCRQQSILELQEECQEDGNLLAEGICSICGAEGKDLTLIDKVENLLPPLELIARAMSMG